LEGGEKQQRGHFLCCGVGENKGEAPQCFLFFLEKKHTAALVERGLCGRKGGKDPYGSRKGVIYFREREKKELKFR